MVRPSNLEKEEWTGIRGHVAGFIENGHFSRFITAVILINAVTLGLETDAGVMAQIGETLVLIDRLAITIFVIEILLKLFVYRLSFFRQGWNVFDFIIVGIALVPSVGPLSVLRVLRILRVLRLLSVIPQMRRVVGALFHALPGMASILAVLAIVFYVASVLVTKLFGHAFEAQFGSIGASMYSLFQIMTLEGWSEEIVRPVMDVYPLAWLFFIPFIIITSFAVLNLFIGIIVDAINLSHEERQATGERRKKDRRKQDLTPLEKEIKDLREDIKALHKSVKLKPVKK